jgi:hypothetical protein
VNSALACAQALLLSAIHNLPECLARSNCRAAPVRSLVSAHAVDPGFTLQSQTVPNRERGSASDEHAFDRADYVFGSVTVKHVLPSADSTVTLPP